MITIRRDDIEKFLLDNDVLEDPEDFRPHYGGRGMYGKTCFGIIGDVSTLVRFVAMLAAKIAEDDRHALAPLVDHLESVSVDGMGRQSIYYWRGVDVVDE